jgi:hypothetical protein
LRKANGEDNIIGKAIGKITGKSKSKGNGKNKGKNNNQLTIKISEKAIDYEEDNNIEVQLAAELEVTIFNEVITTIRSGRIKRASVRYRNSCSP